MRSIRRGNVFAAVIAELGVNPGEKMFLGTEKDRRNGQVHFVNQPRAKVFSNRRDSSAEPDVSIFGHSQRVARTQKRIHTHTCTAAEAFTNSQGRAFPRRHSAR